MKAGMVERVPGILERAQIWGAGCTEQHRSYDRAQRTRCHTEHWSESPSHGAPFCSDRRIWKMAGGTNGKKSSEQQLIDELKEECIFFSRATGLRPCMKSLSGELNMQAQLIHTPSTCITI